MQELRQLKASDVPTIRDELLKDQNNKCCLCGGEITEKSGVALDHQHMFKSETIGEDGAGLIRGVLCRACNAVEGRIWNNMKRYLNVSSVDERIKWLDSLIQYYKKEPLPLIHPSEKKKEQIVSKRNYKLLQKKYLESGQKQQFPEYPKSGKLTKQLKKLFEDFSINAFN
jgi:hypothetical protein